MKYLITMNTYAHFQGVWMGVLTGAGCVSRALGPIFVSTVYARRGPDATFGSTAALTFAALVALRLVYSRLQAPALTTPAHELGPLVTSSDANNASKDPDRIDVERTDAQAT